MAPLIRTHGHEKLAHWLEGARQWPSELHHVGALPWARVRRALRAGADLYLRATDTSPSPLELASEIASEIARELAQHGADSCALVGAAGGAEGRGHHRSSEVIRGHHRSSEVIRGHQRSSEVIRGHHRSSEVIGGNLSGAGGSGELRGSFQEASRKLPGSGAALVLAAARPWSRETHELWPVPHREWAAAVVRLGQALAWHRGTPERLPLAEVSLVNCL